MGIYLVIHAMSGDAKRVDASSAIKAINLANPVFRYSGGDSDSWVSLDPTPRNLAKRIFIASDMDARWIDSVNVGRPSQAFLARRDASAPVMRATMLNSFDVYLVYQVEPLKK